MNTPINNANTITINIIIIFKIKGRNGKETVGGVGCSDNLCKHCILRFNITADII